MVAMIVHKFHSGFHLNPKDGMLLAAATNSRGHFQQGEFDGACGIYCIVMGLVSCGVITTGQARHIANSKRRLLAQFWREAEKFFFAGTTGAEIADLIARCLPMVKARLFGPGHTSVLQRVIAALEQGRFAIVRIADWSYEFDHWTVVSGVQGKLERRRFDATALLLLDPSFQAPRHCLYNGVIELSKTRKAHRYIQEGNAEHVYLVEALIMYAPGAL
ncbi:MAG TPA: hypothetical protein VGN52_24220 [Burkholderiales bacterium]|jgi:hypothetical protein